jgi:hypothetical protein
MVQALDAAANAPIALLLVLAPAMSVRADNTSDNDALSRQVAQLYGQVKYAEARRRRWRKLSGCSTPLTPIRIP